MKDQPALEAPSASKATPVTQAATLQLSGNDLPVLITSTPTDYIGPSIQIVVAILTATASALVIIWQMRRQKTLADIQHQASVKAELRLEAYRDFQAVNRAFSETQTVNVRILLMRGALSGAIAQQKDIGCQAAVLQRTPAIMDELSKHISNATALITFLERYESLLPGFEVHKLALNYALNGVQLVYSHLFPVLLKWLPIDNPSFGTTGGSQFLRLPIITDDTLFEFDQAAHPIEKALGQLGCWASDLAVDMQNFLLGDYADQPVTKRDPIDKETFFTIFIDPATSAAATKYFKETDWWRDQARVKQEVAAGLKAAG